MLAVLYQTSETPKHAGIELSDPSGPHTAFVLVSFLNTSWEPGTELGPIPSHPSL